MMPYIGKPWEQRELFPEMVDSIKEPYQPLDLKAPTAHEWTDLRYMDPPEEEGEPWSFKSVEDKIYYFVGDTLGLDEEQMDVMSWLGHTAIAMLGTLALEKAFDRMTNREAAALVMALFFVYREVSEDDGMGNLDSIMDILGPTLNSILTGVL